MVSTKEVLGVQGQETWHSTKEVLSVRPGAGNVALYKHVTHHGSRSGLKPFNMMPMTHLKQTRSCLSLRDLQCNS